MLLLTKGQITFLYTSRALITLRDSTVASLSGFTRQFPAMAGPLNNWRDNYGLEIWRLAVLGKPEMADRR